MMKKSAVLVAASLLSLSFAASGAGLMPETRSAAPFFYIGAKAGFMDHDDEGNASFDPTLNIGAYGGYNFFGAQSRYGKDLGGGTFSAEGEFTFTLLDGDVDAGASRGDWDVLTMAGYGVYRIPIAQTAYLKGRAGLRWIDVDTSPSVSGDGSDTGFTFGIGAGFDLGAGQLEAELTVVEQDLLFLSVGFLFR
jgi:hypothetical protein